jgi:hypothetical protein
MTWKPWFTSLPSIRSATRALSGSNHVVAHTRNELKLGAVVLTAEHGQPA